MLVVQSIWGFIISSDTHRYLSCIEIPPRAAMWPDYYIPWYWKLGPYLIYGTRLCELPVYLFLFACVSNLHKQKRIMKKLMCSLRLGTRCVGSKQSMDQQ